MNYRVKLRSKNPSASKLRSMLRSIRCNNPFLVRLGSRTPLAEIFPRNNSRVIELNTIEAIENSRNKLRMKACFNTEGISHAKWFPREQFNNDPQQAKYPIVVKQIFGFKGHGMRLVEKLEDFRPIPDGSYVEEFKNFSREYRIHCTRDESFLAWRKLRREDAKERWFFNSTNCNWVSEEHEMFQKPKIWNLMCEHAQRAISATGLTIGAVDVRCKSDAKSEKDFIILEVNSAPELGEVGTESYFKVIKKIVEDNDTK
jgi:glutathione synthase/RimK-type ligase-like ATP-grasp enzyme